MRRASAICTAFAMLLACRKEAAPSSSANSQEVGVQNRVSPAPAAEMLDRVVQISVGEEYSCALRDDGAVYCWGAPDPHKRRLQWQDSTPMRVKGLETARMVSVVFQEAVALEMSGRVMIWGFDVFPRYRLLPRKQATGSNLVLEPLDPDFDALDAEQRFPNDVRAASAPWPPQGRTTRRAMPTRLTSDDRVYVVEGGICLYSAHGQLSCDFEGPLGLPSWQKGEETHFPGLIGIVGGRREICLLYEGGSVRCWRTADLEPNASGPTGWFNLDIPQAVQLAHSDSRYAALLQDGRVAEWHFLSFAPALRDGVAGMKQISLGVLVTPRPFGTCGVRESAVFCWPFSVSDDGERSPPERIDGISNAVHVEVGSLHACVLLADGRVQCWGHNQHGQCGIGEFSDEVKTPTFVVAPEEAG